METKEDSELYDKLRLLHERREREYQFIIDGYRKQVENLSEQIDRLETDAPETEEVY